MQAVIRKHKYMIIILAAVMVASVTAGTLLAQSFWDESSAVRINAGAIESSTLIVGTHLIHLSALTDSVYEIASQSADDSGQNEIYYKSELGGNAWFNITAASSLADITTEGTPVTNSEIEALFFTHHTKSDKVTYDLRTGKPVNIFDIRDPYDLESLEELSPLKMQYDQILELTGADDFTKRIDKIWKTEIEEPPLTADVEGLKKASEYDEILAALNRYLDILRENDGGAAEIDKVSGVMEAVDASRRYLVYATLYPILDSYLEEISTGKSILPALVAGEEPIVVTSEPGSAELISAAAESLGNVQGAMITQAGNMLSEGMTVITSAEYTFMNALIEHAMADNHAACDTDVRNLINLDNIQNDNITDRPRELETLENVLIPDATEKYLSMLGQGEGAEYKGEKANNSAQVILNRFISEYENNTNTVRGELEFLIEAKTKRMDTASGMEYIADLLESVTSGYASTVPTSDFSAAALSSVEAHIEFLTNLHRSLELALGGNELDKLIAEKEDLQTERLQALDNNDLAKAEELAGKIEDIEEEIREKEKEAAAEIAELRDQIASLEDGSDEKAAAMAELSNLENSLSDGSLGALVADMKAKGDAEGLAALLPTSPELALPALQDIYNDLLLNGGDQNLIDTIEQAILDNPNALRDGLGAAQIRKLSDMWLEQKGEGDSDSPLAGVGGIGGTDAENSIAAIVGITMYGEETGNRNAFRVSSAIAQEQKNLGNLMVYNAINDGTGEYIPLTAIQVLTGRRYVWEKNSSLGVLAKGSDYFGFTVYSEVVLRDRDGKEQETMPRAAKYQSAVHIPEEYAKSAFGAEAMYIEGTDLGCVYDEEVMGLAEELFTMLLES